MPKCHAHYSIRQTIISNCLAFIGFAISIPLILQRICNLHRHHVMSNEYIHHSVYVSIINTLSLKLLPSQQWYINKVCIDNNKTVLNSYWKHTNIDCMKSSICIFCYSGVTGLQINSTSTLELKIVFLSNAIYSSQKLHSLFYMERKKTNNAVKICF